MGLSFWLDLQKAVNKQDLGKYGEKLAEDFLTKKSYTILERRFQIRQGEIDIIAQKDNAIIFVEVKTRQSTRCGSPEESVTIHKLRKMKITAKKYAQIYNIVDKDFRLDCIAINLNLKKDYVNIRHYENIG